VETSGDKAAKRQPPTPSPIKGEDFPKPEAIRNTGMLFEACLKYFDLQPDDTLKLLDKTDKSQVADAGESWEKILKMKLVEKENNDEGNP